MRYLIELQAPDGSLMDPSGNLYSHGLATLALCEALAMTRDGYLAPPTATPRWGDPAVPANGGSAAVSGPPGGDTEGNPLPAGGSSPNLLGFAFDATAPVTLPELTRAAQQAVTFIERAQHPAGGWR